MINAMQGEGLAIKLTAARAVGAYAEGRNLPNKLQDVLRELIVANMKEDATDEQMEDLLYEECESKRLDPEEVMQHFVAIGENLKELLGNTSEEQQ